MDRNLFKSNSSTGRVDPTFLYITEDAQVNESMLDTLNQLQMNTPEFYALNNYGDSNMRIASSIGVLIQRTLPLQEKIFYGKILQLPKVPLHSILLVMELLQPL